MKINEYIHFINSVMVEHNLKYIDCTLCLNEVGHIVGSSGNIVKFTLAIDKKSNSKKIIKK